jgi:hypothetical protein
MATTISQDTAHSLTSQDFQALGINDMAYVKPVVDADGEHYVVVHAADGTQMGSMRDNDTAFAALVQQGLQPLSVH